jgi:hypothetical protein
VKRKNTKSRREKKTTIENYKWFSKFSPVEKLRIAKRAGKFLEVLKNAK